MHGVILGIVIGILLVFIYLLAEPFLTASGFTTAKPSARVLAFHYTNWCPHCKTIRPQWERVKQDLADTGVLFQEVDEDIAKTPGLPGVPTIILYDIDGYRYMYEGPRTAYHIKQWVLAPRKQSSAPSAT